MFNDRGILVEFPAVAREVPSSQPPEPLWNPQTLFGGFQDFLGEGLMLPVHEVSHVHYLVRR
jgi:hypothetical protein